MPTTSDAFIWNRATLTERENQMFGALLEVFMVSVINQRQMAAGRTQATPEDASEGIRRTVEWARMRFPDLDVRFELHP